MNTDLTRMITPGTPIGELVLNPSTRVLWRTDGSVQLELGRRAVVVDGVESALIGSLTRARPFDGDDSPMEELAGAASPALSALAASHFLWRRPRESSPIPHPHLAGELAALRARRGDPAAGRLLSERARASVVIHGTGRLAVAVAGTLAGAGVGRVHMNDSGDVHRHYVAPGGLVVADEGRRFNEAAHEAIRRAAPDVETRSLGPAERPDLVVLTGEAPVAPELRDWLHERSVAHLAVRVGADDAVVGPLVLPGLTSCLECGDRARLDRDPAWSVLAVQLATPRRHADPSDLALTQFGASLAALAALAYLDGDEPAILSATLELQLPEWRVRRRGWAVHPDCRCAANYMGRAADRTARRDNG